MNRARSFVGLVEFAAFAAFVAACKSPAPIAVTDAAPAPVPVVASGIVPHEEIGDASVDDDSSVDASLAEGFEGHGKIRLLDAADAHKISDPVVPGAAFVLPVFVGDFGPSARTLFGITQQETMATYGVLALADRGDHWEKVPIAPLIDTSWNGWQLDAVLFEDIDHNEERAPIVIAEYMTGIGPTGAQPFTVVTVYRFRGGAFVRAREIEKILSGATDAKTVRARLAKRVHP